MRVEQIDRITSLKICGETAFCTSLFYILHLVTRDWIIHVIANLVYLRALQQGKRLFTLWFIKLVSNFSKLS